MDRQANKQMMIQMNEQTDKRIVGQTNKDTN
jgi:hypothetical protein